MVSLTLLEEFAKTTGVLQWLGMEASEYLQTRAQTATFLSIVHFQAVQGAEVVFALLAKLNGGVLTIAAAPSWSHFARGVVNVHVLCGERVWRLKLLGGWKNSN